MAWGGKGRSGIGDQYINGTWEDWEGLSCTLKSKNYGDFKVVEDRNSREVHIRFVATGYECIVRRESVKSGSVYDPYFPRVAGVGFTGEGVYTHSSKRKKGKIPSEEASLLWSSMLKRCYKETNKSFSYYGGRGVTVTPDWHNFQIFAKWWEENHQKGYHLDKDLVKIGNKEYGPSGCMFLPGEVNSFLAERKGLSHLPVGVAETGIEEGRRSKRTKPFVGSWKGSKMFSTPQACHQAWLKYKLDRLQYLLKNHTNKINDERFLPAMLYRRLILEYHLDNKTEFIDWRSSDEQLNR